MVTNESATQLPLTTRDESMTLGSLVPGLGMLCMISGVLGAASAVVLLATPPMVSPDRYSYPFDATWYTVAQAFFGLQHLGILCGIAGLVLLTWNQRSLLARVGLITASVGLIGLTACELFAITAANASALGPEATAVNNLYGIPMIIIGVGLVLGGIGVARMPILSGWSRWITLVLGVYVFAVLFPAVFGPFVLGRLAIGIWMLLFGALGYTMWRGRMGSR